MRHTLAHAALYRVLHPTRGSPSRSLNELLRGIAHRSRLSAEERSGQPQISISGADGTKLQMRPNATEPPGGCPFEMAMINSVPYIYVTESRRKPAERIESPCLNLPRATPDAPRQVVSSALLWALSSYWPRQPIFFCCPASPRRATIPQPSKPASRPGCCAIVS